jgi:hypothetical protein
MTILQTLVLAAEAHKDQKRVQGGAYINHPIRVARMLEHNLQPIPHEDIIKAALLHDVLEDTDVTEEDLIRQMGITGSRVIKWVVALTDSPHHRGVDKYAWTWNRLKNADVEVQLIKLADMIDNNLGGYPQHWGKHNGMRIMHFRLRCFNLWLQCQNNESYLPIDYFKRQLLNVITDAKLSQKELVQASLASVVEQNNRPAIELVGREWDLTSKEISTLKDGDYVYRDPKPEKKEVS